jgi:hypothetical protein
MNIYSSSFGDESASIIVPRNAQHHGFQIMLDLTRTFEKVAAWSGLASALVLIAFIALR